MCAEHDNRFYEQRIITSKPKIAHSIENMSYSYIDMYILVSCGTKYY